VRGSDGASTPRISNSGAIAAATRKRTRRNTDEIVGQSWTVSKFVGAVRGDDNLVVLDESTSKDPQSAVSTYFRPSP
jgi:hypothetical protein